LTSCGEGILICVVAVFSAGNAINSLLNGSVVTHLGWGIAIMAAAAMINIAISRYLLRVARAEGSPALEATGIELGTDVITATGVVLGLIVVQVTGRHVVDPVVGVIVSGFIAVAGIRVLVDDHIGVAQLRCLGVDFPLPAVHPVGPPNVLGQRHQLRAIRLLIEPSHLQMVGDGIHHRRHPVVAEPVEQPGEPTSPSSWPLWTYWPGCTSIFERCAYHVW